jgi:hypothetical protein
MPFRDDRADGLYALLYDTLVRHGHRPGLHVVADHVGRGRAWLNAAGFGALGHSIDHAARLYVQAGGSLAADPELRAELQRIDRMLATAA